MSVKPEVSWQVQNAIADVAIAIALGANAIALSATATRTSATGIALIIVAISIRARAIAPRATAIKAIGSGNNAIADAIERFLNATGSDSLAKRMIAMTICSRSIAILSGAADSEADPVATAPGTDLIAKGADIPPVVSRLQRSKTLQRRWPGALPLAITSQAFGLKNIRYRIASGSERDKDATFLS